MSGDFRWPSSNELEIPDLRLDVAPVGPDLPLVPWGARCRAKQFRGTHHFYVDDYRFRALWLHPDQVPETGAVAAVEPNFSVFEQTPFPVALWAIYRKRWLARYWQEKGLAVWVDLNVSEAHSELNLLGVPNGWRHYATRGYDERLDDLVREYSLAEENAGAQPMLIVYGGGAAVAGRCAQLPGAIHFPERAGPRHWKRPALKAAA
jgi:hypothetical protein